MGLTTVGRVVSTCVLLGVLDAGAAGGERLALERPAVVVDPQQPSFVRHAVDDLAAYIEEICGHRVVVRESFEDGESSVIAVGAKAAERFLGVTLSADGLGAEGYVLKSGVKEGVNVIAAAGTDPHGTQAALAALMKRIRTEGRRPFVDGPLDITGKPTFA